MMNMGQLHRSDVSDSCRRWSARLWSKSGRNTGDDGCASVSRSKGGVKEKILVQV